MAPEDDPAMDTSPTKEEWEAYEGRRMTSHEDDELSRIRDTNRALVRALDGLVTATRLDLSKRGQSFRPWDALGIAVETLAAATKDDPDSLISEPASAMDSVTEYSEVVRLHGPDSAEAIRFRSAHAGDPGFPGHANLIDDLARHFASHVNAREAS